jgi:hypothetical protein
MWAQTKPTIQVIIASAFAAVLLAIGINIYGTFSLVFYFPVFFARLSPSMSASRIIRQTA